MQCLKMLDAGHLDLEHLTGITEYRNCCGNCNAGSRRMELGILRIISAQRYIGQCFSVLTYQLCFLRKLIYLKSVIKLLVA